MFCFRVCVTPSKCAALTRCIRYIYFRDGQLQVFYMVACTVLLLYTFHLAYMHINCSSKALDRKKKARKGLTSSTHS